MGPIAESTPCWPSARMPTLTATSASRLPEIRAEVAKRPGVEVQVTGHTDTVGDERDNDELSLKRAEEVLSFLADQGFSRKVMSAVGRGEHEKGCAHEDQQQMLHHVRGEERPAQRFQG